MNQKPEKKIKKLHVSTLHVITAAAALAAFAVVITFCFAWGGYQARKEAEAETDIFQIFNLNTLDGGTLSGKDLRSSSLVAVNIWGTDCPPCIAELPDLEELNNSYDDSEFRIIGIPVDVTAGGKVIIDERVEEAKRILEASGVTYPNLIPDEKMDTFISSAIIGTPTTFFIDSEGNVLKTVTGGRYLEFWKETTDSLLKERSGK